MVGCRFFCCPGVLGVAARRRQFLPTDGVSQRAGLLRLPIVSNLGINVERPKLAEPSPTMNLQHHRTAIGRCQLCRRFHPRDSTAGRLPMPIRYLSLGRRLCNFLPKLGNFLPRWRRLIPQRLDFAAAPVG